MRIKGISDYLDLINEEYKLHFKLFINEDYNKCEIDIISDVNNFRNVIDKLERMLDDGFIRVEYHTTNEPIHTWDKLNEKNFYQIFTSNELEIIIIKLELYTYKKGSGE